MYPPSAFCVTLRSSERSAAPLPRTKKAEADEDANGAETADAATTEEAAEALADANADELERMGVFPKKE
jgi:hypothetical protein